MVSQGQAIFAVALGALSGVGLGWSLRSMVEASYRRRVEQLGRSRDA